ncbi:hypothetical protein [Candidatus Chlorohelix sp.]|uniref:hypothetical protein n=1 Tax=Candidatus Chlorohelix sp. TaxID=3139201 RepID=UPI00303F9CFE
MAAKYEYGVLNYYPTPQAWIINFTATDPAQNIERKATSSAEGIRVAVLQVIKALGDDGWIVFQVDGYIEREYPVYHLRRVSN